MKRVAAACVALATIAVQWPSAAQNSPERELGEVRERLEAVERELAERTTRREDGLTELRRIELAVAEARAELGQVRSQQAAQREQAAALAAEEALVKRNLASERGTFAEQVRMSYMTGRQEVFKLLLNQEDPAQLGRMLTYFDYMNRARSGRIEAVTADLQRLDDLATESRAVRQSLEQLESAQQDELGRLASRRDERTRVIASLDAEIASAGAERETLQAEAERLTDLVEALAEELASFPVTGEEPFADWRGRLPWPVEGTVIEDFGGLREGGPLRWNGVLLEAEPSALVRAVYHGRVAFADWLPGLGLLVILDHGDGYMSLYGHNELLLREPGDWVQPGEVVGQVGDTGGRPESALYFAIRHNGEPEDPNDWVK